MSNKAIAGFDILSIQSEVDNEFDSREGMVIVKYLKEAFPPLPINFNVEIEIFSSLKETIYSDTMKTAHLNFRRILHLKNVTHS